MSYYNICTQQPVIQNQKDYKVDSNIISIQSEDRDITKWPSSSHFEVTLPVEYRNVVSLRALDIQIPNTYYTFSCARQNTKLILMYTDSGAVTQTVIITILDGTYNNETIAQELQTQINIALTGETTEVLVKVNPINSKIYFFSNESISIDFTIDPFLNLDEVDLSNCPQCTIPPIHQSRSNRPGRYTASTIKLKNSHYDTSCNNIICPDGSLEYTDAYQINHGPTAYDKRGEWGLGNYLGFLKNFYTSELISTPHPYSWIEESLLVGPVTSAILPYVIEGSTTLNICDLTNIYMEIDKYNCIDELEPYCFNTNANNQVKFAQYRGKKVPICCNLQQPNKTYNGIHNSAFAIVPVGGTDSYLPGTSAITGIYISTPPVPKLQKLKLKFRWHDGLLVDFHNCNVNLVIEIVELKNEMNQPPRINNMSNVIY